MKPRIEQTHFGSITIEGVVFPHDVIIRLDGQVKKRKKKLSKAVHGTSHILSLAEAQQVYEKGAEGVIIRSGQQGMVVLSDRAAAYFAQQHCAVHLGPTPAAIQRWNQTKGVLIGLFHVTC